MTFKVEETIGGKPPRSLAENFEERYTTYFGAIYSVLHALNTPCVGKPFWPRYSRFPAPKFSPHLLTTAEMWIDSGRLTLDMASMGDQADWGGSGPVKWW